MENRAPGRIAFLVITIMAGCIHAAAALEPTRLDLAILGAQQELLGGARAATGWEPGRLTAFAARQSLRDEVCIAMADGHISRAERYMILSHAKGILKPEEYAGLKRSMDRLSPLKPIPTRRLPQVAQRNAFPKAAPLAGSPAVLHIPSGVVLPDRIALLSDAR
jgi:hypothetical protein